MHNVESAVVQIHVTEMPPEGPKPYEQEFPETAEALKRIEEAKIARRAEMAELAKKMREERLSQTEWGRKILALERVKAYDARQRADRMATQGRKSSATDENKLKRAQKREEAILKAKQKKAQNAAQGKGGKG